MLFAGQQPAELVATQGPFKFHSAFWPNLHNVLFADAWDKRPPSEDKAGGPVPGGARRRADRGRPGTSRNITYEPYMYATGMMDRVWPNFRKPLETHWAAFVRGEISREEAIRRVVGELSESRADVRRAHVRCATC